MGIMKKVRTGKRRRIFAGLLCMCMLFTTQPEIWSRLSVSAAEQSGTKEILAFVRLPEGIKGQTVPVGTGIEELKLPGELTVYMGQEEASSVQDTGKTDTEENTEEKDAEETVPGVAEGEEVSADESGNGAVADGEDAKPGDSPAGGETAENNNGTGETREIADGESTEDLSEGITESDEYAEVSESAEAGGSAESDAPEQAAGDDGETSMETVTVELEEYYAGPEVITVYTMENPEKETSQTEETIAGITWQSDPAYDGNTEGTYLFTAVLPDGYTLADGVSLPQITVTVLAISTDATVQELLARIAALPEAEEILAKEPDEEDAEAYEEWAAALCMYGEEAFAILEAYEELTKEQQAKIPGEAVAKLMAWAELAEVITGGQETYASLPASGDCGTGVTWRYNSFARTLIIEGSGPMVDYDKPADAPWSDCNGTQISSLTINEGITHIGNNAFAIGYWTTMENINNYSGVTIPSTVKSIGANACPNFKTINMAGTDPIPELGAGCFKSDCKIRIPSCEYYNDYCDVPSWEAYKGNIEKIHTGGATEYIRAKEPTCVDEGNKEYWRCDVCGDLFADSEKKTSTTLEAVTLPIDPDNHSYTYTAEGAVITESCANGCGHSATATLSVKSGANLTYTGSEVKPMTVTYSDGWGGDKSNDTRIRYSDNVNVGTAKAELTIGGATAAATFQITEADMEGVTASGYTGAYDAAAHGITVNAPAGATVKYGTAPESCTQTASPTYTDVGVYTVYYQVTKNNYNRKTGSAQVTINARSISDAAVTLSGTSLTYNGSEQTKKVSTVTVNGSTLTSGTDYTVSGNKGTAAKTYTMTLTGKGNYTGTKTADFTIAPKALSASMITVAAGPHYYTGNAVTPDVTVKDEDRTLTAGTDYTVSYKDNTNAGTTATVTITGNGNYTGTASQTFTIQYGPLPADKKLTDFVTVSPAPVDGWYPPGITLSPKNGCDVGETPSDIGSTGITVTDETGTGGGTKTIYIKDGSGNIYQTEFTYKLDKTPPVIDLSNMSVVNGAKNPWNWITGKKSMIIRIPEADITDALSGIGEVAYTAVSDDCTQKKEVIRVKSGSYEIALNAEFSGTIRLTAKDKVGNPAEVSLTAAGGKVIAEDYAPVVTITLSDTPEPGANGWYNTTVPVHVTVTDDKDAGNADILSGGIARIVWKDGENGTETMVSGLPGDSPVYEKVFDISVDTDGAHTYYIKATDNAGNESGWQTVTVKRDTGRPVFSKNPAAANHTQEGADITFTPSEGGKVYWLVNPETVLTAQEVAQKGTQNGNVKDEIMGGLSNAFTVAGLTPGETHKVYVVLEDAAGNLSEVREVSFTTLQAAPDITLDDLIIDHAEERIKVPDSLGEVEVYTDPANPEGSRITSDADGSLPVEPGTSVYIRYPEKREDGEVTPPGDSVKIDIPDRAVAPAQKQVTVTDTIITVTNPVRGEEYVLVPKGSVPAGQEPDWSGAEETGVFTGLEPNQEYELWVRKKATGDEFASHPVRTDICTKVTVNTPAITGEGAGKPGNTAPKPTIPDTNENTVPFTGTYGEEYTPIIRVDGQEITPGMTWDEGTGKGKWDYSYSVPDGTAEVEITVEFRKRTLLGIAVTPDSLKIYADHAANRSAAEAGNTAPLTAWLEEEYKPEAVYDNKTEEPVQGASYATTDQFAPKGGVYSYVVSAEGEEAGITLTVTPVNAAVAAPDKVVQIKKSGGYAQMEVAAWLPAQAAVTYTGNGYTARTENRAVTWDTAAIGADFGGTPGVKTVNGDVDLPEWATGQTDINISIEFTDKKPSGGDQDKDKDKENGGDGNNGDVNENSSGGGENGGASDHGSQPIAGNPSRNPVNTLGTPSLAGTGQQKGETVQQPAAQRRPEQGASSDRETGRQAAQETTGKPGDRKGQEGSAADTEKQGAQDTAGTEDGSLSDGGTVKEVAVTADHGKLVASGEDVSAGNVAGMEQTSTAMMLGEGTVFVTVVCEEEKYTAGVRDTAAVANAVLSPEHIQLVNDGQTIEIRVDVKDISQSVPQQDQEVIEKGFAEYQKEVSNLVLGRYVDISMFMRLGEGDWDAVTSTEEPIEVVIGIPKDMQEEGREFYIIRAHEGEHTFLRDLDEEPDTITISTDMFSSYAIAYAAAGADGGHRCGLCHICPTFLGICCFIWLAVVIAAFFAIVIVILHQKKNRITGEE